MNGDVLRLGIFSPSVVLGVAAATQALKRAGLTLEEIPVTSSAQQFSLLLDGRLDAVLTSPDNVLAYRGSAANPLGRAVDVRILAAVDRGLGLSLFGGPGVSGPGDLRGGVLAVDVPTSGFALAGYELLAREGLRRDLDYEVRARGSTPLRATALIAGECTMTVLNAGSDLRAEAAGCVRLRRASSLGPYVGTVLAAPGPAIEQGRATLGALTEVVVATCRLLAAGAAREPAAQVTADRLRLDPRGVLRHLETLADPREGLIPDGRLDSAALGTLRRLRARHGDGAHAPGGPDPGLVDERFLPPAAP